MPSRTAGVITTCAFPYRTRTRAYNAAGWQISATDALGRQVVTEYDRGGRRTAVYDLRPASVAYTYDNLDRVIGVTAAGITPIAWAYDLAGRRTSMVDASGSTAYTYDGLDRPTTVAHTVTGTVSQSFDLAGRRTSLATSTGLPTQNFLYDDAGRLTEVQRLGLTQASATFDAGGRLTNVSRANGLTTTNSYDNANRLTRLQTLQGGTPWSDFQYTVGRGGLVTAASETIGASSRSLAYTYDGLERLTQAVTTPGDTYAYTYDAVGNRLTVTVSGLLIENRTYDAADQVIGWSYDATGNLLNDGVRTYSHDALNRLTSTTGGGATAFLYTGDNALAVRTTAGLTTTYTLDPAAGLTERLGSTTASASTWYSRGWGQELTRDASGTLTYLLADRLGSIRAEADSAGTLTSSLHYDPYGTPQGTAPTDFGFTGEPQAEAGGGLVHLRARWCAPVIGQFVSRDTYQGDAASPRSFSPYAYAWNDPVNGTDPMGQYRIELLYMRVFTSYHITVMFHDPDGAIYYLDAGPYIRPTYHRVMANDCLVHSNGCYIGAEFRKISKVKYDRYTKGLTPDDRQEWGVGMSYSARESGVIDRLASFVSTTNAIGRNCGQNDYDVVFYTKTSNSYISSAFRYLYGAYPTLVKAWAIVPGWDTRLAAPPEFSDVVRCGCGT